MEELVVLDEGIHERIMALSKNAEMLSTLRNINARIQYVRIGQASRAQKYAEHRAIAQALKERDADKCAKLLYQHIEPRLDQITAAVKDCYGRIYVGQGAPYMSDFRVESPPQQS